MLHYIDFTEILGETPVKAKGKILDGLNSIRQIDYKHQTNTNNLKNVITYCYII